LAVRFIDDGFDKVGDAAAEDPFGSFGGEAEGYEGGGKGQHIALSFL